MENYDLKVQPEGQKFLVRKFDELVAGERERHEKEKLALIDRLTDARHEIGALEQKLLQLEAPQGDKRGEPIDVETNETTQEKVEGSDGSEDSDRPHHNEQGGG